MTGRRGSALRRRGSDGVSPTAHYTGHVWGRNGLSHRRLATPEGRLLYGTLVPAMAASRVLGGPTIQGLLLARHRVIDRLLADAIEDGRVTQVLEVACGMSPRGWRFAERYGDRITYVEADLPAMADRKRRALADLGSLGDHHRVTTLDALADRGGASLSAVAESLDPGEGLAIVSEGLLPYFGHEDVVGMWRRFATTLGRFSAGLYLADVRLGDSGDGVPERAFSLALSLFVGRRVHTHFSDEEAAERALREATFARARVRPAGDHPSAGDVRADPGARRVQIIEATTAGGARAA